MRVFAAKPQIKSLKGPRDINPYAITDRPKTNLPASTLHWAYKADTRSFIDMPFNGFLSPSSDIQYSTRIMRHLYLLYIIFVNFFKILYLFKLLNFCHFIIFYFTYGMTSAIKIPSNAPTTTSSGVCPINSFKFFFTYTGLCSDKLFTR